MHCWIGTFTLDAALVRWFVSLLNRGPFSSRAISIVAALCVSAVAANAQTLAGLDWNGTGTVKRGLYWTNAVPDMAPMTVLMKKYPRVLSATDRRYYTDFFWGNHGKF